MLGFFCVLMLCFRFCLFTLTLVVISRDPDTPDSVDEHRQIMLQVHFFFVFISLIYLTIDLPLIYLQLTTSCTHCADSMRCHVNTSPSPQCIEKTRMLDQYQLKLDNILSPKELKTMNYQKAS